MKLINAALNAFTAQAVAFFHSQRQKQIRRRAVCAQRFGQECERCDAIDIVIAEKNNPLAPIERGKDSRYRRFHVRKHERIAERFQSRVQKRLDLVGRGKAFTQKQPRDAFASANFAPRNQATVELFGRKNDPATLHRLC